MEWLFWLLLLIVAVTFQVIALSRGSHWGMLTSSVRWLRTRLVGRLFVLPAWTWLTWHWFMEPRTLASSLIDDALAVAVGVALALLLDYRDWRSTTER